jgi:hypothetical protein
LEVTGKKESTVFYLEINVNQGFPVSGSFPGKIRLETFLITFCPIIIRNFFYYSLRVGLLSSNLTPPEKTAHAKKE